MAKARPLQTAFNSGTWAPLVEGRTDVPGYRSAVREALNTITIPEGPALTRTGTEFRARAYSNTIPPRLLGLELGDANNWLVEACVGRHRFHSDDGLLTRTPTAVTTLTIGGGNVLTVTSTSHGAVVGEQVVFDGFGADALQGAVGTVATVPTANTFTVSAIRYVDSVPALGGGETAARVYHIASVYTEPDLSTIQVAQSADVAYLVADGPSPRILARYASLNWTDTELEFRDGPYGPTNSTATTITVTARGHAVDDHGGTTSAASGTGATNLTSDDEDDTSFTHGASSEATITHDFGSAVTITHYYIERARESPESHDPFQWKLLASSDNVTYVTMHTVRRYEAYVSDRTEAFEVTNAAAYRYWRLVAQTVQTATKTGFFGSGSSDYYIHIGRWGLQASDGVATLTASSTTGINGGDGFQASDVGRHIRVRDSDGYWRWGVIETVTSTTVVDVTLMDGPFRHSSHITTEWRLGLYSETTGYPRAIASYQDRLWFDGGPTAPDTLCASTTGGYSATSVTMSPTTGDGAVIDTSGIVATLNAKSLSRIRWIEADENGLLVGTGKQVWRVRAAAETAALSATNRDARPVMSRGMAGIDPVVVDNAILAVNRVRNRLIEITYDDGVARHKPRDLSLFAQALAASATTRLSRLAFSEEPYPIVWAVRADGRLLGCTYHHAHEVVGWHEHTVGAVDDIAVMTDDDETRDALWLCTARSMNGETERFIERLTPVLEEETPQAELWYVDCGLRYDGAATDTITGLWHLEGEEVSVCVDGARHAPVTVENGTITLADTAEVVTIGVGYVKRLETMRPTLDPQDGTGQGQMKRNNRVVVRLWRSLGGTVRRPDDEDNVFDIEHQNPDDPMDTATTLFSGDVQVPFPAGYDRDGTIVFEQGADYPLPLNIVCVVPHLGVAGG